ncbi:hemicentin-2-like [Actinia tenebrosa]|uniref:Hemicentin-2-like n=1 Tax=Actinia tenebrosa TaxID=6105 RepID=A0A6P8HVA9_ACTTE|nr:hemicentin-2-like [Actinia tenebrosa]
MGFIFVFFALLVSAEVLVQLPQASSILISENRKNLIENQRASAFCNTSGFPNANVTWFKDSQPNVVVSSNPTLIFKSILRSNGGRYICNASNGSVSLNDSIFFNVMYPPEIVMISDNRIALENSSVTLRCIATGNPIPKIRFSKEGKSVPPTKQTKVIIELPRIQRTDSGTYRCSASNGIGNSIEKAFTLDVQYPPNIFYMPPKVKDSWLHDNVTLVCDASGNPTPTYTWRPPRADPIHSNVISFVVTNESQFGVYYCVVQNIRGGDSYSLTLNRTRFPPDPPIIANNVTTVTSRNFTLKWTRPNEHNSNITRYLVMRTRFFNNGSMDKMEYFSHDTLLHLNMSFFLDWGTSYRFAVSAENRQGDSGAGPPTNITVIAGRNIDRADYIPWEGWEIPSLDS